MKKLFFLLSFVASYSIAVAQTPQLMNYQAVLRDANFQPLVNKQVGLELYVKKDTSSGQAVYRETHMPTTMADGLVQLEIGSGTSTDQFSAINWSDGPYFLITRVDPEGGTDYTITGGTKLLSVPYAHTSPMSAVADTVGRARILDFRVSGTGDSLILKNGVFLIVPGISGANSGD